MASAVSIPRQSGWARSMSARARSRVVRGFRLTTPYSVTTYCTSDRGVVTMVAGGKVGTIRL